jgi:hypothetical protein
MFKILSLGGHEDEIIEKDLVAMFRGITLYSEKYVVVHSILPSTSCWMLQLSIHNLWDIQNKPGTYHISDGQIIIRNFGIHLLKYPSVPLAMGKSPTSK